MCARYTTITSKAVRNTSSQHSILCISPHLRHLLMNEWMTMGLKSTEDDIGSIFDIVDACVDWSG
jgi:hypothetical protein